MVEWFEILTLTGNDVFFHSKKSEKFGIWNSLNYIFWHSQKSEIFQIIPNKSYFQNLYLRDRKTESGSGVSYF